MKASSKRKRTRDQIEDDNEWIKNKQQRMKEMEELRNELKMARRENETLKKDTGQPSISYIESTREHNSVLSSLNSSVASLMSQPQSIKYLSNFVS